MNGRKPSLNVKRTLAQAIATGGALAAALEVREGSFPENVAPFSVVHALWALLSIWMLSRAWREIGESAVRLQFARKWYLLSDAVVVIGLYGVALSRSNLSAILIVGVFCLWVGKRVVPYVRKYGWK